MVTYIVNYLAAVSLRNCARGYKNVVWNSPPGAGSLPFQYVKLILVHIQNVVKAGSNLLAKKKEPLWKDLPQSDQNTAATRLVNAVEKSGFKLANTIVEPLVAPIVSIEVNISE